MENSQILQIIESGESQEVEFKESLHSSQDFSKLMCGFANTYGGVILIGINKKKEVLGVKGDLDEIQQRISSSAQAISSPLFPSIEIHKIGGKKIIAIIIQQAIDNTFHSFQGVLWVRIGSTLKKVEGNQIVDFLRGKQILSFDESLSNARIEDLDMDKIKGYLSNRKQSDYLNSHSIEDFLLSTGLARKNGELKIKNSTLLFFSKKPLSFNPQIEIKAVRFGDIQPVKIISHELIQSDIVESIEKAISFTKNNISKSINIGNHPKREELYQYPLDVIRESIVNAIVHRDYFSKDAIQIYIFSDRIEITNPGSLPKGLTKELFGTLSVQRNPLTYRMLRDYGYVEGLGSGVPRMINSMREQGLSDPEFGIYEHFFRITLRNKSSGLKPINNFEDLNERQLKAIEFLRKNKSIKTSAYVELNDVSLGTARIDINELIKFGYFKKIGKYRGVHYILNEEKGKDKSNT